MKITSITMQESLVPRKVAALVQAHDLDIAPHGSQHVDIHPVSARR